MKLVVGLGNPGRKYAETRHNIGWMVLAELKQRYGKTQPKEKFHGELVEAEVGGEQVLLLAPHTFMNRSGQSVLAARDFYKLSEDELLIVCDDFSLPLTKLRIRPGGSSGGQKGLADIVCRLGHDQFSRLRMGIGPVPENWDPAGFVLGKFAKEEREDVSALVTAACEAVTVWTLEGMDACMNQFNGDPAP
jgi:PTH1 family peptidyl-tRNA hydrolase